MNCFSKVVAPKDELYLQGVIVSHGLSVFIGMDCISMVISPKDVLYPLVVSPKDGLHLQGVIASKGCIS